MRISSKGRYALAAIIEMALQNDTGQYTTVAYISDRLGISKIYLEQVFSLLRRGGLVISEKGAQGGYRLARMPREITVYDILTAAEPTLFERTRKTVHEKAPDIEAVMTHAWDRLHHAAKSATEAVTIQKLTEEADRLRGDQGFMFFI